MAAAVAVWAGVALTRAGWWALAVAVAAGFFVAGVRRRGLILLGLVILGGVASGAASLAREQAALEAWVPAGLVELTGVAVSDSMPSRHSSWFLLRPDGLREGSQWVEWSGPPLRVFSPEDIQAGQRLLLHGTARSSPGIARGQTYAGQLNASDIQHLGSRTPIHEVANAVRDRIGAGLEASSSSDALLAGFLIGDVRNLPAADRDAMRKAGLSHFVAVSGSNVALFLGLWWLIAAPVAMGSRRRAIIGVAGLVLFVVITRAEPSVVRAGAMAALVLVGRAVGIPIGPWTALGLAVSGSLLVSGELAGNVGFQLSVAATAGVLGGTKLRPRGPQWLVAPLAITLGAQLAVAPLLVAHFGTIPVAAPLTNLIAAPLVGGSTVTGGLGLLLGVPPLTEIGTSLAGAVLDVAWFSSSLPQLGWSGLLLLVGAAAAFRLPGLRIPLGAVGLVAFGWGLIQPPAELPRPAVVFFDVEQGDAAVVLGTGGETLLIDGGPDPVLLADKLRKHGISHLDLLIISHPHADHTVGLQTVAERMSIGEAWHSGYLPPTERHDQILGILRARGVPTLVPKAGASYLLGSIEIEILGPKRRYASPNDQSLVALVTAGDVRVLFTGDVERFAQADLGRIQADILKVPHQGATTSDPSWVTDVDAQVAVISVGPNDFGHPDESIIDSLRRSGAAVVRTDEEGDVIIPLG